MLIPKIGCYSFSSSIPVRVLIIKDMGGNIIYARKFDPSAYKFDINFNKSGGYFFVTDSNAEIKIISCEPLYIPHVPALPITNNSGVKLSGKVIKIKGEEGSPCSVNLKTGDTYVNEKFLRFPYYTQQFIMAHEEGHLQHLSEDDCDYYALRKIVMNGGNIYPCLYALSNALRRNPANTSRIKEFISHIKRII